MSAALMMIGSFQHTLLRVFPEILEEPLRRLFVFELQQHDERGLVQGHLRRLAFLELPLRHAGLQLRHGVVVVPPLHEHPVFPVGQFDHQLPPVLLRPVQPLDRLDRGLDDSELHEGLGFTWGFLAFGDPHAKRRSHGLQHLHHFLFRHGLREVLEDDVGVGVQTVVLGLQIHAHLLSEKLFSVHDVLGAEGLVWRQEVYERKASADPSHNVPHDL